MTIAIIIGIIAAVAVIIFLVTRDKKSKPSPQPRPPVEPPAPSPVPVPPTPERPALPTITMPPTPLMPPPRFPVSEQWHIPPVDDIGDAIMRAQVDGAKEIIITASGELKTRVVLWPDKHLRLNPGVEIHCNVEDVGNFVNIPFRLMEHTSVIGGEGSVIYENESGRFEVIAGYYSTKENGLLDQDITLYGFEVRGSSRKDFSSTPQAISLGNCKGGSATNLFINGTHSIGLQLGGAGFFGHAAEDFTVSHCRFERVASQSLALVNGRRIKFEYNQFINPGQPDGPGSHPIDLEVNGPEDVLYDVLIARNYIDSRQAAVFGNGIIVQATTGSTEVGKIVVEENVLIGGNLWHPVSNNMSNGIYVYGRTMKDVLIQKNKIWRTGQCGLNLEGELIRAIQNELVDCGGGGIEGVRFTDLHKSEFIGNSFRNIGDGPVDSRILSVNSEVVMRDNSGFN